MSMKRTATTELNHDNWDKDEEREEAPGQFQAASQDVLQGRTIKKAKRRLPEQENSGGTFSGFKGFSSKPVTGNATSFSMLSTVQSDTSLASTVNPASNIINSKQNGLAPEQTKSNEAEEREYWMHMKKLNKTMFEFINNYFKDDPVCDLTPVFSDYIKHVSELGDQFPLVRFPKYGEHNGQKANSETKPPLGNSHSSMVMLKAPSGSLFGNPASTPSGSIFGNPAGNTGSPSGGIFGNPASNTGSPNSSIFGNNMFTFGKPASIAASTTSAGGFTFPSSVTTQPPQETSIAAKKSESAESVNNNSGEDNDEYHPPKNEFTPVSEDGAFYSVRSKLYYKKEGKFEERGVGMLHLKELDDAKQLIVRGDSTLGTILLNVRVTNDTPVQRSGKKDVIIACIPNPKIDPKAANVPIPFLIRVSSGEEADELFSKLK